MDQGYSGEGLAREYLSLWIGPDSPPDFFAFVRNRTLDSRELTLLMLIDWVQHKRIGSSRRVSEYLEVYEASRLDEELLMELLSLELVARREASDQVDGPLVASLFPGLPSATRQSFCASLESRGERDDARRAHASVRALARREH